MPDTGNYISRHDAEHADSTAVWRVQAAAARHYQPRRLATAENGGEQRLAELSGARHQPRHAA